MILIPIYLVTAIRLHNIRCCLAVSNAFINITYTLQEWYLNVEIAMKEIIVDKWVCDFIESQNCPLLYCIGNKQYINRREINKIGSSLMVPRSIFVCHLLKLRLGALIPRSVCLFVCLCVGRSKNYKKITKCSKSLQNITKYWNMEFL